MKKLTILLVTSFIIFPFGLFNLFSFQAKAQDNSNHVPGRILVSFKDGVSQTERDGLLRNNRAQVVNKLDVLGVLVLQVPQAAEEKVATALSRNPHVEYAELDYTAETFFTPDDTYFNRQWGFENTKQVINGVVGVEDADIDASTAWDTELGNVKVAILDTGINESHQDLTGKVVGRQDFTGSLTSGTNDVYGHGSHVAGIVAANTNNGKGVAGVCPNCTLLNGKVLNDNGSGAYSWIANGITWATINGAKVINMSLGGSSSSRTLERAVNYAWKNGVVVVAAAGNSNNPSKTYPAAYTNVIAVAATDNQDKRAYFSSYGAKWVDVAAPGVFVYSTWKGTTSNANPQPECDTTGCYKYASGTSMSTPIVSGVVGLIWSTNYGISASAVRTHLESTTDKISGTGTYWSKGRVNAANAVK